MKIFNLLFFIFLPVHGKLPEYEKVEFCETLDCDDSVDDKVCGVKYTDKEVIFKLFDNECKLLKYGCQVDDSETYGIISMKHCGGKSTEDNSKHVKFVNDYPDCTKETGDQVCGIRPDGEGFKIRIFENECQLNRHNCDNDLKFTVTDFFICSNDPSFGEEDAENEILDEEESPGTLGENGPNNVIKTKNLVVVDGTMLDPRNINESIRHFFAATHILDLPMKDIKPMFNESTRRKLVRIFGPIQVFTPWIKIPKNISDDYYHKPTLSSCFHKCPTKCPDTYAPVCGVPGIMAREPSLMFQNHCFMDVAQCKMSWEGKSFTAESSTKDGAKMECSVDKLLSFVSYIESSFLFCLGDEMNGLYRFLPLVKTLQHMGRLKNRGQYKYKIRNMKFFNNLLGREPKLMG